MNLKSSPLISGWTVTINVLFIPLFFTPHENTINSFYFYFSNQIRYLQQYICTFKLSYTLLVQQSNVSSNKTGIYRWLTAVTNDAVRVAMNILRCLK